MPNSAIQKQNIVVTVTNISGNIQNYMDPCE